MASHTDNLRQDTGAEERPGPPGQGRWVSEAVRWSLLHTRPLLDTGYVDCLIQQGSYVSLHGANPTHSTP